MALKALDIFKLTPKKNCKDCGFPTCMAFCMKVASGAVEVSKCPHMSDDALSKLSEATAPLMRGIKVGAGNSEYELGAETVLFRHEKTLVSKNRYAVAFCDCMTEEEVDKKIANINKVEYEREILKELEAKEEEMLVLAGYMRLIGPTLLNAYPNRILNIHPALLPEFPGLHGIRDAFEAGVKQTGVTVHYVDNGVDTGPILAQKRVNIEENETLASLELKIHQAEHQLYPEVIQDVIQAIKKTGN